MDKGMRISLLIGAALAGVALFMSFKKNSVQRNSKKIVIGDSHAVGIGSASKGVELDKRIAVGGWMVSNLINALNGYPTRPDIGKVIISIGTNGQFSSSDNIEYLVQLVKQKFPNAGIYLFKGSYGWSGNRTNAQILDRMSNYYHRFEKYGVNILKNGLGYFSDGGKAHSVNTPQAKAIINEIENI